MCTWIEVRMHEKIHNAYTEKFLRLGARVFMADAFHMAALPSLTLNMQ